MQENYKTISNQTGVKQRWNSEGAERKRTSLQHLPVNLQARTRYTFFASAARKEGYEQIGSIFQQTSDEEKEHAKLFFNQLKGGDTEITAAYPSGIIGFTRDNLRAAARGEKMEWGTLYPAFARAAEEEGFGEIALLFRQVAKVEAYHERRYAKLFLNLENGEGL